MSELEKKRNQRKQSNDRIGKYASYAALPFAVGCVLDLTIGDKGRDSITVATGNPEFPPLTIIGIVATIGLLVYFGAKGKLKSEE
tara:strand:- start:25 stop:279 length:255 start_codon:yes stop_codon:yes gene_type:complete